MSLAVLLHERSFVIKMLKVSLVLFSLFILYGEIACTKSENRIVNGLAAQPGDFPYQVSLQMNKNLYCGGTIIDEYHVLTAAHCVEGVNIRSFSVVVGNADLRNRYTGARHSLARIIIHNNYQPSNGWPNDIALLRLATPITFGKYVAAATLPQQGEYWYDGQSAVVSGFGLTHENSALSLILYKTQVFMVTNGECQQSYGYLVKKTNICTRNPTRVTGFCRGDSGGPLSVNGKVVGVVSFSMENGCAGNSMLPQVYTRVSAYVDWINYWRQS